MDTETKETNETPIKSLATYRYYALVIACLVTALGALVYTNATTPDADNPFKLGLDLAGGSHLVYEADVSSIAPEEVGPLMTTLREVIERRVNVFGVSEPLVQVESSSFAASEQQERLVVELPGVTDVDEAVAAIGQTPLLEFKLVDQEVQAAQQQAASLETQVATSGAAVGNVQIDGESVADMELYIDTGLTGRYLESAALEFAGGTGGQLSNEPVVSIRFTSEGAALFESITRDNTGEFLAIFLDGELMSAPRINEAISGGQAIISGGFSAEEARSLARNLSFGALPVPIELQSTQTIDATLGAEVIQKGMYAGLAGIIFIFVFLIAWYRVPGMVAALSLVAYICMMLALFQYIPVTLTAAGLAGFILSLGMAVDANVLVFERMKEEYRSGASSRDAARDGFARAWSAIRDGNITSLISAIILFWFGTSLVKGFALVFGLGIIISMISALVVTRTLLLSLPSVEARVGGLKAALFDSGLPTKK